MLKTLVTIYLERTVFNLGSISTTNVVMATTRNLGVSTLWKWMVPNYKKFSCWTAPWQTCLLVTFSCCNIHILQILQLMLRLIANRWKLDWQLRILHSSLSLMPYRLYNRSSFIGTTACTTCPIIGWFKKTKSVWSRIVLSRWSTNLLSVPIVILGGLTSDHSEKRANTPILFDLNMM